MRKHVNIQYPKRLLKLADVLEANAKNKKGVQYNQGTFGSFSLRMSTDGALVLEKRIMSCGTTACAMGLAAYSGAFKKQGLSYHLDDNGTPRPIVNGHRLDQTLKSWIKAAEITFGITPHLAGRLFGSAIEGDKKYDPHVDEFWGAKAEKAKAREIRRAVKDDAWN